MSDGGREDESAGEISSPEIDRETLVEAAKSVKYEGPI